jgi:hypothetical protein
MGVRKHCFRKRNHTSHCNCSWGWICSQYILGIPCCSWVLSSCYICSPSLCLLHSNTCDWWLFINPGFWLYLWGCWFRFKSWVTTCACITSYGNNLCRDISWRIQDPGSNQSWLKESIVSAGEGQGLEGLHQARFCFLLLYMYRTPGDNLYNHYSNTPEPPSPGPDPDTPELFIVWSYYQAEEQPQDLHALWRLLWEEMRPMAQTWAFSLNLRAALPGEVPWVYKWEILGKASLSFSQRVFHLPLFVATGKTQLRVFFASCSVFFLTDKKEFEWCRV